MNGILQNAYDHSLFTFGLEALDGMGTAGAELKQASGHLAQTQPSFHSWCSTIREQNHSTLACSPFQTLDILTTITTSRLYASTHQ